MIEIRSLVKSFDGFRALDGLDLTVPDGAVYGLCGSNGAGKSTAIRHLAGILRQDSGEVLIGGKEVFENPELKGRIAYIPDVEGKMPLAIISHGFNGTHAFGRNYFEPLAKLGFQTYTFDFPCGSIYSRSDNNTMEMSVFDEKDDLKAIVNYFKQQPYVDASRIVLIGESQGGLVTALAAAEMKKDVSEIVLVYPALCIPDNWNERYPKEELIPDTTLMWKVPLGRRYFKEVRPLKVFKQIGKFKRPVLIVQGDKDQVVSMKDSERAVETYKNARLHVIPGARHGFKPHELKQSVEQITLFLNQNNPK